MSIVVNRVELRDTTSTEEIAFGTTETTDDSLYTDQKKVVTKGRNGKATRTYQTTTVNGVSSTVVVKTCASSVVSATCSVRWEPRSR